MQIVMLEKDNLGTDLDFSMFDNLGDFMAYPSTSPDKLKERIKDAEVILVNKLPMKEETLRDSHKVKLICETATGVDNIDLAYAKSRGIAVANVKGYSTMAVAQHTFAMLFYVMEKLPYYDTYVKSGEYASQPLFSHFGMPFMELDHRTFGIIGLGEIGRAVARAAEAFGCTVVYYSASGRTYDVPYRRVDFDTLLAESDVISIHSPLTDATRELMCREAFEKMKPTAYLLNAGRGPIVNDADLAEALEKGRIAGAALDVLSAEPMREDNPLNRIKDNCKLLITPHMAWAAKEARERLLEETCRNIEAFLDGRQRNRL